MRKVFKIMGTLTTLMVMLGLAVVPAEAAFAGPLVGWGNDDFGQATVPAGYDFVAIAGGGLHSVALIPEPATMILLGMGLLAGAAGLKKKKA